jgi:predicted permease
MAMLLVGFVLGSFPFRELFRSTAAYVVSAIRLVLIPSLFGIPLWLLGQRGDSLILPLVMTALPVGMNVVVFTEANGIDNKEYSRICFISCMMAAFIIPIAFSLIAALGAGA